MFQAICDYWQTIDWEVTAKATRYFTASIASVVGAVVACKGLSTWRKQLRGNAEYDLARRVMKASLKVRKALRRIRNPLVTAGEEREALRQKYSNKTDDELKDVDSNLAVYDARWQAVADVMLELRMASIEAEVIWKDEAKQKITPLGDCVFELRTAVDQFLRLRSKEPPQVLIEREEEIDRIIYEVSSDPEKDAFTKKISDAVEGIQDFVSTYLRK